MGRVDPAAVIATLARAYAPLFESSPDGVYLWLDETNKVCNDKLATIFGRSVDEWKSCEPFLESFIAEADRDMYGSNYHRSVAHLSYPITFRFRGIRADGTEFAAETDMVPIVQDGYPVALHFVRQIAE